MAELSPFEQIAAGGVDSRSNPINMPRNRALRCLNWVPKQADYWELRWGYTTVSMSSVTATAIHSMFPYRTWDGHKYVLFMQGTTLNVLDTATGNVTTPAVRGAAVASSAKGAGFFGNNRFHYGNGTDQKWFDATTWRDSGLRAPTTAEVATVVITDGVRELTSTENSTITLTAGAGGSFPADSLSGHLIYVAIFDTGVGENDLGPSTIFAGTGRIKVTLNQKITVANMPNLSGTSAGWVKLIAGTTDGGGIAYFFTNTLTNIVSVTAAGQVLTVIATGHGLTTGDVVILSGTGNSTFDGIYAVTVVDANTFTVRVTYQFVSGPNTGAVGTVTRVVSAGNAVTSIDVLAPTMNTSFQANAARGLPASTVGGSNPGYQFYLSIYNPNGGAHVGNRTPMGGRFLPGTSYGLNPAPGRCNYRFNNLPTYQSIDTEWALLIGRTGDGAAVPYVVTDNALNWFFIQGGIVIQNAFQPITDGNHELPTRNGIIPSQCNMFCLAGDYAYAADTGSPFLRRSGSFADDRAGLFTGRPEQSWAGDDIDTFPTAEAMTAIFEVDQGVLCGTLHDSAISENLSGVQQWTGPFNVGIAGRRAGTKCGAHGFYWLSGDKQLCTLQQGVPVVVSEEYELAELSQIGDSFLSTVELVYYRSAAQNKDELRVEGQKQDGTPYTIIHDFKLREFMTPPGSVYGQGYSSQFQGPLGTVFTSSTVRDGNGKLQIYAGASTGQIYQMYSGADDVGNQFTADGILLINGGTNRPDVPIIDFHGDQNIILTVGRNLQTSLATGAKFGFSPPSEDTDQPIAVPGSPEDFLYRVFLVPPEVQYLYLRFQLTSHSANGNLNLNSPPHLPLENYGRLYEFIPSVGDERDR